MHETSTQDTRVDFSSGSCGFRCSCPGTPYAFDVPLILVGLMVLVQTALVVLSYVLGICLYDDKIAMTMGFYTLNIIQMFSSHYF